MTVIYFCAFVAIWFFPFLDVEFIDLAGLVYIKERLLVHLDGTILHERMCIF